MSLQNLLSQLTSNLSQGTESGENGNNPLSAITSVLPGGLAGGAAAGGVIALLMGSKSARKMAGSAAKIGGAALLGGLAYKAFSNWKENRPLTEMGTTSEGDVQRAQAEMPTTRSEESSLSVTLVKAMISAAKSDGHLDPEEQKFIFSSVEKLNLSSSDKSAVFDALSRDIPVTELANSVSTDEHKAEVYLSAYLAIEVDNEKEREYLDSLARALQLPGGLPAYLEQQAQNGYQ